MRRQLITLLGVLALIGAPPAAAGTGPAFGVHAVGKWPRGYFVYAAPGGRLLHGSLAVVNSGGRAGAVKLYAVDATTGRTSGAVYLTSGETLRGAGSWIRLGRTHITLRHGQSAKVPFTVEVPAGSDAGQYVGGIAAETVARTSGPSSKGKARVQINVRNLSIIAVQVNVPGELKAGLEIGKAVAGGLRGSQQVSVHIANTGNVLLKPRGSLTVTDRDGHRVAREQLRLDTVLPGTEIDYPVTIHHKGLSAGTYRTHVTLRYRGLGGGGKGVVSASPSLTVTKDQVTQVFGKSGGSTPPPSSGAGTNATSAPAPGTAPAGNDGDSGSGTLKLVLLGLGAVILLGLGYLAASWRTRRPSRSA